MMNSWIRRLTPFALAFSLFGCESMEPLVGETPVPTDSDLDGVVDGADNCPTVANTDQTDTDGDGTGDACEEGVTPPPATCGTGTDDSDCDGSHGDEDCAPFDPAVHPGANETCDGKDNNCNGQYDENDGSGGSCASTNTDNDNDGYSGNVDDCNDSNAEIHPGATEVCDGVDNDCDTQIDEGVSRTWYSDVDGDGYGNASSTMQACTWPGEGSGWVSDAKDCDDSNAKANPGQKEVCDGADNDCDGSVDDGSWQLTGSAAWNNLEWLGGMNEQRPLCDSITLTGGFDGRDVDIDDCNLFAQQARMAMVSDTSNPVIDMDAVSSDGLESSSGAYGDRWIYDAGPYMGCAYLVGNCDINPTLCD